MALLILIEDDLMISKQLRKKVLCALKLLFRTFESHFEMDIVEENLSCKSKRCEKINDFTKKKFQSSLTY